MNTRAQPSDPTGTADVLTVPRGAPLTVDLMCPLAYPGIAGASTGGAVVVPAGDYGVPTGVVRVPATGWNDVQELFAVLEAPDGAILSATNEALQELNSYLLTARRDLLDDVKAIVKEYMADPPKGPADERWKQWVQRVVGRNRLVTVGASRTRIQVVEVNILTRTEYERALRAQVLTEFAESGETLVAQRSRALRQQVAANMARLKQGVAASEAVARSLARLAWVSLVVEFPEAAVKIASPANYGEFREGIAAAAKAGAEWGAGAAAGWAAGAATGWLVGVLGLTPVGWTVGVVAVTVAAGLTAGTYVGNLTNRVALRALANQDIPDETLLPTP